VKHTFAGLSLIGAFALLALAAGCAKKVIYLIIDQIVYQDLRDRSQTEANAVIAGEEGRLIEIDPMTKNDIPPRTFLMGRAFLALGVIMFGGAIGLPEAARSAEPGARGKTVQYLTFGIDFNYTNGLEFEYQTALLEGIKKKAAEAGLVMQVFGCKGNPQLQLTQILDAVTKKPDALLINPLDAKLIVAGVKRANEANIPIFIIENPPAEGKFPGPRRF
jgi:hypothetical protein